MNLTRSRWLAPLILLTFGVAAQFSHAAALKTENVFLIISDGFRWQEVFTGAEADLINRENGVKDTDALRAAFWRATPAERRQSLLPFFWSRIATQGQIFGNQTKGSVVQVSNGKKFSYPGYNEIITGSGDPRVDSNDKRPNPNTNVFEWLNHTPALHGKVAVLGTWDVFPYIFNVKRSHLPIWPGGEVQFAPYRITAPEIITELALDTTPVWGDLTYDSFLIHTTMDYVTRQRPHLVFVGFGETDEWAHAGRYDLYLTAANHVDRFIQRLWDKVQSLPEYRDKTTFIITADHGRGSGPDGWRNHSEKIEGAEGDWIAVIGPDTPPLGERTNTTKHTQSQIASTIAALLGTDFRTAVPKAAPPIDDILGRGAP